MSSDSLEVLLVDEPLVEEIGLLTDLIVVATEAVGPLDWDVIDATLRLR